MSMSLFIKYSAMADGFWMRKSFRCRPKQMKRKRQLLLENVNSRQKSLSTLPFFLKFYYYRYVIVIEWIQKRVCLYYLLLASTIFQLFSILLVAVAYIVLLFSFRNVLYLHYTYCFI